MKIPKFFGVVCAVVVVSTAAFAAKLPSYFGDAQPKPGGTVVYGIESDIPSLDPHITFGGSNKRVVMSVFEGLVKRDRAGIDLDSRPFVRPEIGAGARHLLGSARRRHALPVPPARRRDLP